MKRITLFVLSIATGLLLFGSWPESPFTFLIFFSFIPLLIIADKTSKRLSFFGYSFLSLLLFNASTTWWIWNSTDVGSIAAIVANTILMCIPWWGYHLMLKKHGQPIGYASLIGYWMLFEYIHLNWQLSWPWLTLGNVFASNPAWVQWYEYTGVGGGTLWILLSNILLKQVLNKWASHKKEATNLLVTLLLVIIIPGITSYLINTKKVIETPVAKNVVIVQGNINPYEKFDLSTATQGINRMIALSEGAIDSNTNLVVWPETALSLPAWQDQIMTNSNYQPIYTFLEKHPNVTLLAGIETYKHYGVYKATETARKLDDGSYGDAFNSAIYLKANQPFILYNKSKLVPGVESMPTFLNFLAPIFEKFGGTTGGYGRNDSSMVFSYNNNIYHSAPIICYESIYGEYVSSYIKRGANLITIITNDGWWGNTPGHQQHKEYARLRAIETRRWVARSANMGISSVIDTRGNMVVSKPWNEPCAIKYNIPVTSEITFYVLHGDYLYKIFCFIALLLFLFHSYDVIKKKVR